LLPGVKRLKALVDTGTVVFVLPALSVAVIVA
jgi:hypothetical protein